MNLSVEWDGANRPFEGQISIPIDLIPAGARVSTARVEVTPHDPGDSFIETISFDGPGRRRWGANRVEAPPFVEVDFRARRTLAAVRGLNLTGTTLLIDPGGMYVEVNDRGAIRAPGDDPFALPAPTENRIVLPSFVIARFKLTAPLLAPAPELASVEVRSVPENVSLRLGDDPPFHTFLGPMTSAEISVDFAVLLQEFLTRARVENGFFVVPLVIHSDTISRLKVRVTLDVLQAHDALAPGVGESVLQYSFNAIPAGAAASLSISLAPGSTAVAGETALHFLGSFDDTRIAYGPIVPVQSEIKAEISSQPGRPQAQAQHFKLEQNLAVAGIDLLLRATTQAAQLQVDVRDDLGGKPGLSSVLPSPLSLDLSSTPSANPAWASIAFPEPIKLNQDVSYWLVVQRTLGDAAWSARPAAGLPMQQTSDGGLSWRKSSAGAVDGYFRLRHRPARFTMPIHVFVGEGELAREVPLAQYEPLGRVDFTLDTPAFADAITGVLAGSAIQACSPVEHLENGEFHDWLRIGETASPSKPLQAASGFAPRAFALSPDGKLLYILDQADGVPTLQIVDPICGDVAPPLELPHPAVEAPSFGAGMAITPDGRRMVAHLNGDTWLIDLDERNVVGQNPASLPNISNLAADNQRLYFATSVSSTAGTTLQFIELASIERHLTSGSPLTPKPFGSLPSLLVATGLTVTPDGSRIYVTANGFTGASPQRFLRTFDPTSNLPPKDVPLTFAPSGLALHPEGQRAFIGDAAGPLIREVNSSTGAVLQSFNSATSDPSNSIDGLSMAAFASGLLAVSVNRPDIASVIELIEFGAPVPEIWQLVAPGRVSPFCLDEPFRIAALFGEIGDKSLPPSSISQVVPVSAGCLYEFSYWGIANADGAAGEILWRTADCSSPSKDVLPVQASRPSFGNASRQGNFASLLKFHRLRAKSPDGAIAAEIRFRTTFDMWALIDRVSFGTVDPTLANSDFLESEVGVPKGWTLVPSSAPGFTFSSINQTATLFNNGIETVALTQTVNVKPGASANVEFAGSAQASEDFPFLEVAWRDSDVPSVAIVIAPGSPRQRSAVVDVPDGVTEAEFAIQLPAGSQVVVERLRVLSGARLGIPIRVFAEAPGELTVSNINVVTDTRPSHPPPAPETGLCAPTPPGKDPSGEDCDYCPGCAGEHGTRHAEIVLTPARRTAVQARCVNCGTATVRPARRAVASASAARMSAVKPLAILRKPVSAVAVRSLVAPSAAVVGTGTPVVASGAVALKAILGLRIGERTSLENAGIRSVQDLASASPERVAKALQGGSSPSRPAQLISRARGLLIEQ